MSDRLWATIRIGGPATRAQWESVLDALGMAPGTVDLSAPTPTGAPATEEEWMGETGLDPDGRIFFEGEVTGGRWDEAEQLATEAGLTWVRHTDGYPSGWDYEIAGGSPATAVWSCPTLVDQEPVIRLCDLRAADEKGWDLARFIRHYTPPFGVDDVPEVTVTDGLPGQPPQNQPAGSTIAWHLPAGCYILRLPIGAEPPYYCYRLVDDPDEVYAASIDLSFPTLYAAICAWQARHPNEELSHAGH